MNFGEVFLKAAKITWNYKILWIAAILVNIISLSFSFITIFFSRLSTSTLNNPANPSSALMLLFLGLICVIGPVAVILGIVLGTANTIIVSRGANLADLGTEHLSFRGLVGNVRPYFWRVLGLSVLFGLITVAIFLPFICVGIFVFSSSLSTPAGVLSLEWVIYPLSIFSGTIITGFTQQSLQSLILENLTISEALSRGWKLYTHYWGINLLVGLVLTIINLGLGYLFGLPESLATSRLNNLVTGQSASMTAIVVISGIAVLYLLVHSILSGMIAVYYQTGWTLTYLRMTRQPVPTATVSVENA